VTVLVVAGVSHGYGDGADRVQALTDVSLTVAEGEVVCVAGPSGSGKTALCHLVAGLETPDTGSVTVAGTSTAEVGDWSLVAVVPQQHGLLAELSVEQNVALPAMRASNGRDGATDLLAALDLGELAGRAAAETSLGEQQRTAIARALVLAARVLVLDEPTGHQDDGHVEQVLAAVRAAAAAGSAVLVASHDDRVLEAADRVVRLAEGRLS
jgi:ABC-type lipoprotein export system ATPase subunit